jgi:hypothetical protein
MSSYVYDGYISKLIFYLSRNDKLLFFIFDLKDVDDYR